MTRHETIYELRKLIAEIEDGLGPEDVANEPEDLTKDVGKAYDSGEW